MMDKTDRDYGWLGRVGIGTPQANPTVEAEMRRLIPKGVEYFTLRLTSASNDPSVRLKDYATGLPTFIEERFAGLEVDAFFLGCTASTYLLDPSREADIFSEASEKLGGAPIISAAHALRAWLKDIEAKSIAVATPYPDWLFKLAEKYWQKAGYDVVTRQKIDISGDDTYGIYQLQSVDARPALEKLITAGADAIIISGTGMPSLSLLKAAEQMDIKIMSSNYATAIKGLAHLNLEPTTSSHWG